MKMLAAAEARKWCQDHNISLDSDSGSLAEVPNLHKARFALPQSISKLAWLSSFIASKLRPWERCLLWVTQWGIWGSSENWHLYYRLRQSYGDHSLIDDASAHLFLDYEDKDLVSFIQIALSAGWDFALLTDSGYARAFISHDEWIEFAVQSENELVEIKAALTPR